ncbi:MAG: hypothetical protein DLM60_09225 [Pseudonocardiales bacterium]|nr:MAG: hypothetical protein DLM60_09225 [Pseudonocardiales bacterium]
MAVPCQEVLKTLLQPWRQVAPGIALRQHGKVRCLQRGGGGASARIRVARAPQFQIHLGGDVVRQPTQHLVPFTVLDAVTSELAGKRSGQEPCAGRRSDRRHDRDNRGGKQPLGMI